MEWSPVFSFILKDGGNKAPMMHGSTRRKIIQDKYILLRTYYWYRTPIGIISFITVMDWRCWGGGDGDS